MLYNCHMLPAIFLDRDGVIIENQANYVRDWSQAKVLSKAIGAIANLHRKNLYKIVIVTNQSVIGRGLISLKVAQDINKRLVNIIENHGGQIEGVYMCPHKPEDLCGCRKPNPGLFFQAAKELSLDLSQSWMVGDAWSDLLAGQAAGLRGVIMVKTGRGAEQLLQPQPETLKDFYIYNDLSEALEALSHPEMTA